MPDTTEKPAPRLAPSADSMAAAARPTEGGVYAITMAQIDQFTLTAQNILGALVLAQVHLDDSGDFESRHVGHVLGLAEEAMKNMRLNISGLAKMGAR